MANGCSIPKLPLLTKPAPFDEEAVNAEFQDEYDRIEQRSRQLDLNFQDLVKDLRLWICASTSPVSEEAKVKYTSFLTFLMKNC